MYHPEPMAATILIVEDEYAVARGVQYALQQEGYQVALARSGEEGLSIAGELAPDLVLLDVRLPGIDGFEVLRRLRASGSKAPVLMLTARDEEMDKVIGLELGADDYLTKPFGLRELMSRIKALLRRAYGDLADAAGGRLIRHHDLVIDLERRRVQRGTNRISLTATEFEILRHLASKPGTRLHAPGTAGAGARLRGPGPGREDDQRPRQPPAREAGGRPVQPRLHPHRARRGLRLRRALSAPLGAPATPSDDQPMTRRLRTFLSTYRVRLVLAFALVVAVALGLVLATLPRLLDGYLLDQEKQNLQARADSVAELVQDQLTLYQTLGTSAPRPILLPTTPVTASDTVDLALGTADAGFLADLTPTIALADVTVAISPRTRIRAPSTPSACRSVANAGQPGQQREPTDRHAEAYIADTWWASQPAGAPLRLITVTLSDPFTSRA